MTRDLALLCPARRAPPRRGYAGASRARLAPAVCDPQHDTRRGSAQTRSMTRRRATHQRSTTRPPPPQPTHATVTRGSTNAIQGRHTCMRRQYLETTLASLSQASFSAFASRCVGARLASGCKSGSLRRPTARRTKTTAAPHRQPPILQPAYTLSTSGIVISTASSR